VEVFVFARLHARPGLQHALHQAMSDVEAPTRAEPGCLGYGGFQSVRDADEFYIHSRWQDMAAFDRHTEQVHTTRFVEAEPLLDHPLEVTLSKRLW
jgi:quinol monooxygenase YgiN